MPLGASIESALEACSRTSHLIEKIFSGFHPVTNLVVTRCLSQHLGPRVVGLLFVGSGTTSGWAHRPKV